jgi:hypothetical protein
MANVGTQVVQVDLVADGGVHTVIWVEAILHPVKGMRLTCGKDPRSWTVNEAYVRTPVRMDGINSGWKVGGL